MDPSHAKQFGFAPALQQSFGQDLIRKQFQLQNRPTLETLNQLIELYTTAIQYYQYMGDEIYIDYQQRMQKLFMRQDILRLMQKQSPNKKVSSVPGSPRGQKKKSRKQKNIERNRARRASMLATTVTPVQIPKQLQMYAKRQEQRSVQSTSKARKDVLTQEKSLEERLEARKEQKKISLSMVQFEDSEDQEEEIRDSVLSLLQTIEQAPGSEEASRRTSFAVGRVQEIQFNKSLLKAELLERQIEQIMEDFLAEKYQKLADIEVKYRVQMEELGDDPLMRSVKEQMKSQMNQEKKQISFDLDQQRVEAVRKAKEDANLY